MWFLSGPSLPYKSLRVSKAVNCHFSLPPPSPSCTPSRPRSQDCGISVCMHSRCRGWHWARVPELRASVCQGHIQSCPFGPEAAAVLPGFPLGRQHPSGGTNPKQEWSQALPSSLRVGRQLALCDSQAVSMPSCTLMLWRCTFPSSACLLESVDFMWTQPCRVLAFFTVKVKQHS